MAARGFLSRVFSASKPVTRRRPKTVRKRIVCLESLERRTLLAAGISDFVPVGEPGPGGRIDSISIQPGNSSRILVGGDIMGATLSIDGGATWNNQHEGWENYSIGDFTWDPQQPVNPQTVWAGTAAGPHVSYDAGVTWELKRNGMAPIEISEGRNDYQYTAPIEKILYDPNDPTRLFAFEGDHRRYVPDEYSNDYYNAFDGVIWTSIDGGDSWSEWSTPVAGGNIVDAEYGGASGNTMYVVVYGKGIYRSFNDGAAGSWTPVNNGLTTVDGGRINVMSIAVHPTADNIAWAVTEDHGIFRTYNSGNNWSSVHQTLPLPTNDGGTYTSVEIAEILPGPDAHAVLYLGYSPLGGGAGLYKSVDKREQLESCSDQ